MLTCLEYEYEQNQEFCVPVEHFQKLKHGRTMNDLNFLIYQVCIYSPTKLCFILCSIRALPLLHRRGPLSDGVVTCQESCVYL